MLRRASSLLASSLLRASRGARGVSSSAAARGSAHVSLFLFGGEGATAVFAPFHAAGRTPSHPCGLVGEGGLEGRGVRGGATWGNPRSPLCRCPPPVGAPFALRLPFGRVRAHVRARRPSEWGPAALRESAESRQRPQSPRRGPVFDPQPPPPPPFQDPDYVHAKHMYDIQSISNRRLKFGLGTIAVAGGGAAVTAIAVNHAQSKAKGG